MVFSNNPATNSKWVGRSLCVILWSSLVFSLAVGFDDDDDDDENCRSGKEIIKWKIRRQRKEQVGYQREALESAGEDLCSSQSLEDAKDDAFNFLRQHVMKFDQAKLRTLGFGDSTSSSAAPDGLDNGLIGPTIDLALQAKIEYPWTDELPQDIFYEYVLNYANLNEGRSNWRPLLWDILHPMIIKEEGKRRQKDHAHDLTPNDVVRLVNEKLWSSFPGRNSTIYFKHGLTPLIFDPMSVIAFGYASCTGLAILFVNALRTVGIAARVVGTPAWNSNPDKGNHNWIEVYYHQHNPTSRHDGDDNDNGNDNYNGIENEWVFLEPSPNLTTVDDLTTKPCSKWFCEPGRFPPPSTKTTAKDAKDGNQTRVYSARLVFSPASLYYPMAWELDCMDVPGEDRTHYYQQVCSHC